MAPQKVCQAAARPTKEEKAMKWQPKEEYPEPMIKDPHLEHRQTFIILHGRGNTARGFAPPFLAMPTTSNETIQTAFPHAKLVFLTASRNRAEIYGNKHTRQWFDNWHPNKFHERHDLVRDGLYKSCNYVHGILQKEIDIIGEKHVVLWGLSQGSATSMASLLTWNGEPFAATVGMCGYLPFANLMIDIASGKAAEDLFEQRSNDDDNDDDADDPFSRSDDENEDDPFYCHSEDNAFSKSKAEDDLAKKAADFLRNEIDMEGKTGEAFKSIPVFLGHGTEDEKVSVEFGREVRDCLEALGTDVEMVEYDGLGHTYSPAMLDDIFEFLREKLRIE